MVQTITNKVFNSEIELFYQKTAEVTLNSEIIKEFEKIGRELAKEVIAQYDFKQMIEYKAGVFDNKIIITTVFEKKNEKTKTPKPVLVDTHITVHLRDPYWGAWKKYGWEKEVEGLGIRVGLIWIAEMSKKKILFRHKYGDYEIAATKARDVMEKYGSLYIARDGTEILVIPRSWCKKIIIEELLDK